MRTLLCNPYLALDTSTHKVTRLDECLRNSSNSIESSVHAARGSGRVSELAHKASILFDATVQQFAGELEINICVYGAYNGKFKQ